MGLLKSYLAVLSLYLLASWIPAYYAAPTGSSSGPSPTFSGPKPSASPSRSPTPSSSPLPFVPPTAAGIGNINRTHYTRFSFNTRDMGRIHINQFVVDFNSEIFIRFPNASVYPFERFLRLDQGEQLELSIIAAGTVRIVCDGEVIPDTNTNPNGLPVSYLTSPPTTNPASSLMTYLFGGKVLNTTSNQSRRTRWAATLPSQIPKQWRSCFVTFKTTTSTGYLISDANGVPFNNTVQLNYTQPKCDYDGALDLSSAAAAIIDSQSSVTGFNDLNQLSLLMSSIEARESFEGCFGLMGRLMTQTVQNRTTPPSQNCDFPYEDSRWGKDPCCNHTMLAEQCCLPKVRTIPIKVVQNYSVSEIASVCRSTGQIKALLANYVSAQQNSEAEKLDLNDLFQAGSSFIDKCNQEVYNTVCKTDADCPYHAGCDQRSGSGQCIVDWDEPAAPILACYVARMPPDVKLSLKEMLRLPPVYSSLKEESKALTDTLTPLASTQDCVGPSSFQYRKQTKWTKREDGNFAPEQIPTNVTGCLSEYSCTYQPWDRTSRNSCLKDPSQTGFCAQCIGSYCVPVTQFSSCRSFNVNKQYCDSVNASFIPNGDPRNMIVNNTTPGSCEFFGSAASNNITCLRNAPACIPNSNDIQSCMMGICVNNNVNNPSSCNGPSSSWDNARSKCIVWNKNINECLSLPNHQYLAGRNFFAGNYETQQACSAGACNQWDLRAKNVDEQTCKKSQYCTFQCPTCRSNNGDLDGGCLVPDATSQSTCPGFFDSRYRLCLSNDNRTSCIQKNYRWSSCSGLSAKACDSSTNLNATIGRCFWDNWAPCPTKEACLSLGGQCTDWEFGNGGGNGACVYKPAQPYRCKQGDWGTQAGECIDPSASDETRCAAKGANYEWRTRAKTETECVERANRCLLPRGQIALYNSSYCASCGGELKPVYKWNAAAWLNATYVNTTWIPLNWTTTNRIKTTLDFEKLRFYFESAIARTIGRTMVANFNQKISQFITIIKFIACDCTPPPSGGPPRVCFGQGTIISTPLQNCLIDPSANATCGNTITIPSGTLSQNQTTSVDVQFVSPASFFGTTNSSSNSLQKRADASSDNSYAIVTYRSVVVGQLIGSGKQIIMGSTPSSNVTICLEPDANIAQDTVSYPFLDFVTGSSSGLSEPLRINVSISGTLVCGSVAGFNSSMFFPILRKDLTSVTTSTTTATATTTTGASGGAAATTTTSATNAVIATGSGALSSPTATVSNNSTRPTGTPTSGVIPSNPLVPATGIQLFLNILFVSFISFYVI